MLLQEYYSHFQVLTDLHFRGGGNYTEGTESTQNKTFEEQSRIMTLAELEY